MKVTIRAEDVRFSMSVPVGMIGFVVRRVPEKLFQKLQDRTPEPYRGLLTKGSAAMLLEACTDILKENKGLEVVHVETADGTFVSIRL